MSRPVSGKEYIAQAVQLRDSAKTVAQFRQALAVLLPLQTALSVEQTAALLGRTLVWTCQVRRDFIAQQSGHAPRYKSTSQAHVRREKEERILDEVLAQAAQGGVVVVPPLLATVQEKLGKPICLATLYNMLHRHGWRKLAPDTSHPQGDAAAREAWKKNFPTPYKSSKTASRKPERHG